VPFSLPVPAAAASVPLLFLLPEKGQKIFLAFKHLQFICVVLVKTDKKAINFC